MRMPTPRLATTDASAPSQVLFGLTRGDMRCLPKGLPTKYAKMSPAQTSRSRYKRKNPPRHCSRVETSEAIGKATYTNEKTETMAAGNPEASSFDLMPRATKKNGARAAAHRARSA